MKATVDELVAENKALESRVAELHAYVLSFRVFLASFNPLFYTVTTSA